MKTKNLKNKNITTHDELKDKYFGKVGTERRPDYEEGYEKFKLCVLLKEARKKRGLTQEELAEKAGTTKSYISKIENNLKEVRISTLEKM